MMRVSIVGMRLPQRKEKMLCWCWRVSDGMEKETMVADRQKSPHRAHSFGLQIGSRGSM